MSTFGIAFTALGSGIRGGAAAILGPGFMPPAPARIAPPRRGLLLLEARTVLELAALVPAYPFLRRAPAGDGHPVLVLPGFMFGDFSTHALRPFLRAWAAVATAAPSSAARSSTSHTVEAARAPSGSSSIWLKSQSSRRPSQPTLTT